MKKNIIKWKAEPTVRWVLDCNDARFGVLALLLWQPKAITDVALTNRPFLHRPIPLDVHSACGRLSLKPIIEKNWKPCKGVWKVRNKSYLSFLTQSSQQITILTHYHPCTLQQGKDLALKIQDCTSLWGLWLAQVLSKWVWSWQFAQYSKATKCSWRTLSAQALCVP